MSSYDISKSHDSFIDDLLTVRVQMVMCDGSEVYTESQRAPANELVKFIGHLLRIIISVSLCMI